MLRQVCCPASFVKMKSDRQTNAASPPLYNAALSCLPDKGFQVSTPFRMAFHRPISVAYLLRFDGGQNWAAPIREIPAHA
jgi:hypothetical protein